MNKIDTLANIDLAQRHWHRARDGDGRAVKLTGTGKLTGTSLKSLIDTKKIIRAYYEQL